MKRLLDLTTSLLGLIFLSPLLALIALLIKATSHGPILFRQQRVGRNRRPFVIYKFRTMVHNAPELGGQLTQGDDPRITGVGRFLRSTKLDELPQLWNVLKGDMSLVGPRPEVTRYVEMFSDDYEEILRVRPGITDLASIKYRDEAAVLSKAADSEVAYVETVLPEKIKLAKEYLTRSSFLFDLYIIVLTVIKIGSDRVSPRLKCPVDAPAARK